MRLSASVSGTCGCCETLGAVGDALAPSHEMKLKSRPHIEIPACESINYRKNGGERVVTDHSGQVSNHPRSDRSQKASIRRVWGTGTRIENEGRIDESPFGNIGLVFQ